MTLLKSSPGPKKPARYGSSSLFLAVPGILMAAPLIGWFLGSWADGKFDTEPYLTIVGLVLGFVAAGREIYNLIRKAQAIEDKESDKKADGTRLH